MKKLVYLKRIFDAYILRKNSQLSFWHGEPTVNENAFIRSETTFEYYMPFIQKASYNALLDENGIPLLNYHGTIGKQYNPIAIAQYGLGNCNLYYRNKAETSFQKINAVANWFLENQVENDHGISVWMHLFDFEYAKLLKSPWYSGLAQGQILSFLLRAHKILDEEKYLNLAEKTFVSLTKSIEEGGVLFEDSKDNLWIEEYLTDPPMHILNGFIWALWGIYDYLKFDQNNQTASGVFDKCNHTIMQNLEKYDSGFWSLYDLSDFRLQNVASPFYHKLHIIQLEIMYRITGEEIYLTYSKKWANYQNNFFRKSRALIHKSLFKLLYF